MANQFTKAKEEGREPPKSSNAYMKGTRTRMSEEQKDKIRVKQVTNRLFKYVKSKGKQIQKHHMDNSQVSAAKVLMDKWMPSLQAIEQKNIEPPKSEGEVMAQLRSLLADPGARAQIQAMLDGQPHAVESDGSTAADIPLLKDSAAKVA